MQHPDSQKLWRQKYNYISVWIVNGILTLIESLTDMDVILFMANMDHTLITDIRPTLFGNPEQCTGSQIWSLCHAIWDLQTCTCQLR